MKKMAVERSCLYFMIHAPPPSAIPQELLVSATEIDLPNPFENKLETENSGGGSWGSG